MNRSVSAAAIVFVAAIAAGAYDAPAASSRPTPTQHVVVSVDGTKGPGTRDSVDPESPLSPLVDKYMRDNPDAVKIDLRYPGGMVAGIWGWNVWFDDSVEQGKASLRQLIKNYESGSRRDIDWTIIGYSQGAVIAGDIASEIDQSDDLDLQSRTEAILYSDPRQPGTGIETRLPGQQLFHGITFSGSRPAFTVVRVVWRWIPGDTIADSPPVDSSGITLVWVSEVVGGYANNHTAYRYDPPLAEMRQP